MPFKGLPANTQRALELLDKNYIKFLNNNDFYLAGDTNLALEFEYRISYDLDFFTRLEFDPEILLHDFKDVELESIETSKGTLKFCLNKCAISLFYYPYKLIANLDTLSGLQLPLANKLHIDLMKITAIADRGLKKDSIDLYYIATNYIDLKSIFSKFEEKYPHSNFYHYMKALTYFDDAENDPDLELIIPIKWEEVKQYFLSNLKDVI